LFPARKLERGHSRPHETGKHSVVGLMSPGTGALPTAIALSNALGGPPQSFST